MAVVEKAGENEIWHSRKYHIFNAFSISSFPPYGENCALLRISPLSNRTHYAGLRFGAPLRVAIFRFW